MLPSPNTRYITSPIPHTALMIDELTNRIQITNNCCCFWKEENLKRGGTMENHLKAFPARKMWIVDCDYINWYLSQSCSSGPEIIIIKKRVSERFYMPFGVIHTSNILRKEKLFWRCSHLNFIFSLLENNWNIFDDSFLQWSTHDH